MDRKSESLQNVLNKRSQDQRRKEENKWGVRARGSGEGKISIVMKSQATYKAFCTASLMWDFITVYNPIRLFHCKQEDAVLKKKKS